MCQFKIKKVHKQLGDSMSITICTIACLFYAERLLSNMEFNLEEYQLKGGKVFVTNGFK